MVSSVMHSAMRCADFQMMLMQHKCADSAVRDHSETVASCMFI